MLTTIDNFLQKHDSSFLDVFFLNITIAAVIIYSLSPYRIGLYLFGAGVASSYYRVGYGVVRRVALMLGLFTADTLRTTVYDLGLLA